MFNKDTNRDFLLNCKMDASFENLIAFTAWTIRSIRELNPHQSFDAKSRFGKA